MVDQGPTIKRWKPRAMGASNPIRKRTAHVTIILGTKVEPKKKEKKVENEEKAKKVDGQQSKPEAKKTSNKLVAKEETPKTKAKASDAKEKTADKKK